jgi:predicted MPP superfamily phosphohydrolase
MKLTWLSDIHLEFLTLDRARRFLAEVERGRPDAVLITGDISTAPEIRHHLLLLAQSLSSQVYFVLGNHDFYRGDFARVDALVLEMCRAHPNLHVLGDGEIIPLTPKTALIGHRGWADGRAGLANRSTIRLNDYTSSSISAT